MNGNYRRLAPYSAPIPDAPVQTHFVSPCGTVQYGGNSLFTMKWVSGIQMALAILCVLVQAAIMAIADYWIVAKGLFEGRSEEDYAYVNLEIPDEAGTGVWIGLLMIATAAVGIASCKSDRKSLVVAYLVLSAIQIPATLAVIGTSGAAVRILKYCRKYETNFSFDGQNDASTAGTLTLGTSNSTVHDFYCSHSFFHAWLSLNAILMASAAMMLALSIVSLVYSSKAACGTCCRGCCLCCKKDEDVVSVSYHAETPPQDQSRRGDQVGHNSLKPAVQVSYSQPPAARSVYPLATPSGSVYQHSASGSSTSVPSYASQSQW